MPVGLFTPCYIDQFFPHVGLATLDVLEKCRLDVEFPFGQTCCGQPMANTGCTEATRPLAEKFFRIFQDYEYVVCPSGSCVSMVRNHYDEYLAGRDGFEELKRKTYELCEFLTDVLKAKVSGRFAHKIGLHQSCHGLRELRLGSDSEMQIAPFNKVRSLLEGIDGLEFAELTRVDECCGFGGTFAVTEEAVSVMMGRDRLSDHQQAGSEFVVAADMSCLMHLDGLIRREGRPLKVMHVAEILAQCEFFLGQDEQDSQD